MPSSKVSKAGCSSGVYSWRRSLIRKGDSYIIKTLVKPSLIQIFQTPAGTAFKFDSRNCSSAWEAAYPQDHQEPIRLKANSRNSSRMVYSTIIRIYHDFDYSDLVTSSYLLGTHHEFINLQLGHNINYTKPKRLLFRGLTEVNVHYQCFPELETSPPGNTRNTANCEVPQYLWDQHLLSPNLAEETAISNL